MQLSIRTRIFRPPFLKKSFCRRAFSFIDGNKPRTVVTLNNNKNKVYENAQKKADKAAGTRPDKKISSAENNKPKMHRLGNAGFFYHYEKAFFVRGSKKFFRRHDIFKNAAHIGNVALPLSNADFSIDLTVFLKAERQKRKPVKMKDLFWNESSHKKREESEQ
ncbi:MAG: hypothetical protein IJP05_06985 [Oscillospiraceae bacterium]|nr:hypothetical protein [Oscillospiraceae bacterium]